MQEIEIDRTDEEREELVKQWIHDYWLMIVLAILLAIGIVYGIHYYRQSQADTQNLAAVELSEVKRLLDDDKVEAAQTTVSQLQTQQTGTSYATLATLTLAKHYFDTKAYDKAVKQYDWLISSAGDTAMRDIGRLRKARALANDQQFDSAVATLAGIEDKHNVAEANLLKGDILLMNKQFEEAKAVYQALENDKDINSKVIKERINLLTIKQQQQKS